MKTIFYLFATTVLSLSMVSCSRCYDCMERQEILDSSGNVIDYTEVHEDVCTANEDEILEREQNGAVCTL